MKLRIPALVLLGMTTACFPLLIGKTVAASDPKQESKLDFRTSDRCVACHNGMKTRSGEDISIGVDWRASLMANSSRDPYWQGSVRRESIDHPESKAAVEDDCSSCHMPIAHLTAKSEQKHAEVFAHLPFSNSPDVYTPESDGVTCSVCHQIEKTGLGTKQTFNGEVVIAATKKGEERNEYGPFAIDHGHERVMHSSTANYHPVQGDHIRDSALCGTCHTLYTKALGPGGQQVGTLPEQMPYQEWQHSNYPARQQTCQSCHMPEVKEAVAVTALYGQLRDGMHRHVFVGANFLVEGMLRDHANDLGVKASAEEMSAAADRTMEFLKTQAAKMTIGSVSSTANGLAIEVGVENLTGHKLPTAYPSRRAWLHLTVRDRDGHAVFESGALNPDGSIAGNDNDTDPLRFEPHYTEITRPEQVEIFEDILKDSQGRVTTGLLAAVGYIKDNRLLPGGFDKQSAENDIRVIGEAQTDPNFTDKGSLTRYNVDLKGAQGPFQIEAELWYQPVGFRWARNLGSYQAAEPQRFVGYYESASRHSAVVLAKAQATR
jgi:hypothetical protein